MIYELISVRPFLECPDASHSQFQETDILFRLVDEVNDVKTRGEILSHPLIKTLTTLIYQKHKLFSHAILLYHVSQDRFPFHVSPWFILKLLFYLQLLFAILYTCFSLHVFITGCHHELPIITNTVAALLTVMVFISSIRYAIFSWISGLHGDLNTMRRHGELFSAAVAFFMCILPNFGYGFDVFKFTTLKDVTAVFLLRF